MKQWTVRYSLWGAVVILHLAAYLSLAMLVSSRGPLPMDRVVRDFFQGSQDVALGWMIREWAIFGDWRILTVVLLLLGLFVFREMGKEFLLFFLFALGGGGALGQLSKVVVGRLRPGDPRFGFPSGHTLAALVTVSGLLYFAHRGGLVRRPVARASSAVGGVLIVLGVGVSRVYTDNHWLTDVFGGILLGIAMAVGVALALEVWSAEKDREAVRRESSAVNHDFSTLDHEP
ncbi:MAG: phosphatase PAP2 family protein [Candidatus Methylomirabilales bacterium]